MWTILGAVAVAAAGVSASSQDRANWIRQFADNESQTFEVKATMGGDGASLELAAEVVFKVKGKTSKGASIAMSAPKFELKMDGSDAGQTGPDELTSEFHGDGIPHVMSTENFAWIYILAASSGMVPAREIEMGKSFTIDWSSADKACTVKGSGKLLEWVEKDGKKAAKIAYELDVSPSDPTPGHVKCETFVERETGAPIACEGSVDVNGQIIKYTVKRLK